MSGLEAFSLACNIMTVITFALNTAEVCRNTRESGSSDKNLEESTEYIGRTLNNVERLLQQQPTAPTKAEIDLRELATKCIGYNEAVQKELKKTSPKDSTKRAALGSTIKTMMRRPHIDKLKSRLEAAQKVMDSALSVQILNECMKSRASNHATYSALDQENQAYETFLNSLRYANMNDRKNRIPQEHEGTFEWIFESRAGSEKTSPNENSGAQTFADNKSTDLTIMQSQRGKTTKSKNHADLVGWLQKDGNCLYWVSGKPGSGKSTFMKFVENDKRTQEAMCIWTPRCQVISHYLWKPGTEDQQSFKGLLCSLIHQILTNEKAVAIRLLSERQNLNDKRVVTDWDLRDLKEVLFQTFHHSSWSYLVLMDGLDELAEPHGGLSELFNFLNRVVAAKRVKLCVSSRPEHIFTAKLDSNPSLRMQDLTRSDIHKYTADYLEDFQLDPGNKLYEKILHEISWKAEGVFIWVYLVLRNVKNGVKQYNESWDDIFDRIVMLPPDLMALYKDMWSRLEGRNEKHVKKAARYFQYIKQETHNYAPGIARLSLIADDETLERFTRPNGVPCVDKWNKMCEDTFKTLIPFSAGFLEAFDWQTEPDLEIRQSEDERKIYTWENTHVNFIHRTAIDFLDSSEAKEVFGRHPLGPEDLFSVILKAEINYCSVVHNDFFSGWAILEEVRELCTVKIVTHRKFRDFLSLLHQCAMNESRGLVQPPQAIGYENFFLLKASLNGHYDYVRDWLESSENYDWHVSTYVLIGACNPRPKRTFYRYPIIRDTLKKHLQSEMGVLSPSAVRNAGDNIMLAWRCFLLHELSLWQEEKGVSSDVKQITGEILELFIQVGVMAESPGPKYLIVAGESVLKMVKRHNGPQSELRHQFFKDHPSYITFRTLIYTEVNDAFLLQRLPSKISRKPDFLSVYERDAFMKPILARQTRNEVDTYFHIKADEGGHEASKDWIFGGALNFDKNTFPDNQPRYIQVVRLGEFPITIDALEKIGYHLPLVNKGYDCWHN